VRQATQPLAFHKRRRGEGKACHAGARRWKSKNQQLIDN
jgi:hypothetical protein